MKFIYLIIMILLSINLAGCKSSQNTDEVLWETPANFSEYASLEAFYEYLTTQERAKDYISTTGQWEVVMETKFINTRREGIIT